MRAGRWHQNAGLVFVLALWLALLIDPTTSVTAWVNPQQSSYHHHHHVASSRSTFQNVHRTNRPPASDERPTTLSISRENQEFKVRDLSQATKLFVTSAALMISLLVGSPPTALSAPWTASRPVSTLLHSPSLNLAAAATTASVAPTTSTKTTTSPALSADDSMLEEVWNLINKYYLDPNFAGQDWNVVHDKYRRILQQHATVPSNDNQRDIEFQITAQMVQLLQDKYSRMLDVNAYAAIQKYDLIGVGVTLMPNPTTKQIQVGAPPVPHSAAADAGLRVGDYVDAVNGVPTLGRTAFDIIDQITETSTTTTTATASASASASSSSDKEGPRTVTMTIRRPATSEGEEERVFDVTMERQFQKVNNPIKYKITETRRPKGDNSESAPVTKVGWIRISEFNSLVKIQLEQALQELHEQGANAYVLDIRHNTGGAFQSAVEIASLFLEPHQVATYVVDRNQATMPFFTTTTPGTSALSSTSSSSSSTNGNSRAMIPSKESIVIWTDGSSASASEVLAGALRDNCRAVVMGDTSFGKGLIQAVYGLKNGSGLVLTVARYVTPKGYNIQGVGITPDIPGHVPTFSVLNALGIGDSDDTSQIDFDEVAQRLAMCQPPPSLPSPSTATASSSL